MGFLKKNSQIWWYLRNWKSKSKIQTALIELGTATRPTQFLSFVHYPDLESDLVESCWSLSVRKCHVLRWFLPDMVLIRLYYPKDGWLLARVHCSDIYALWHSTHNSADRTLRLWKVKRIRPGRGQKDEFDLAEKRPTHLVSSAHRGSIVFPAFAYFVYYFVSIFLHFE